MGTFSDSYRGTPPIKHIKRTFPGDSVNNAPSAATNCVKSDKLPQLNHQRQFKTTSLKMKKIWVCGVKKRSELKRPL